MREPTKKDLIIVYSFAAIASFFYIKFVVSHFRGFLMCAIVFYLIGSGIAIYTVSRSS